MSNHILAREEQLPGGKVRLWLLLPGNRRHNVTINQWENNGDTRSKIAAALIGVDNARTGEQRT